MSSSRSTLRRTLLAVPALLNVLAGCRDDATAPPSTEPRAVSVTFCAATAPTWVAFRDGDGAWTRALPDVSGGRTTFRYEFSSDRAAIATLTPLFEDFTLLRVLYGLPAELSTQSDTARAECTTPTKRLTGSVTGVDTVDFAAITLGFFVRASVFPRGERDFSLEGVSQGPLDLLAARVRSEPDRPNTVRFILRRDVDLPDGAAVPQLDFNSAEAFDAATRNVTMSSENLDVVYQSELLTSNGLFPLPFQAVGSTAAPTQPYLAIPENKLRDGDMQLLHASSSGGASSASVDEYFRTPANRTMRFGAALMAPSLSAIGTQPTLRIRAHFTPQDDYDRSTSIVYDQPQTHAFVSVAMTPNYAAMLGAYDIDVPDLVAVPGFDPTWTLRSGMSVAWTAIGVGGTLPLGNNPPLFDGAIRRTSSRQNTFAVP